MDRRLPSYNFRKGIAATSALAVATLSIAMSPRVEAKPNQERLNQAAATRTMLGRGDLLIRTGTCRVELELAEKISERARLSNIDPGPSEYRAAARLADLIDAPCVAPSGEDDSATIELANGARVVVTGDTAIGNANNADNLCKDTPARVRQQLNINMVELAPNDIATSELRSELLAIADEHC